MEYLILKQDGAEWDYLWNTLAKHPLNENFADPFVAQNELNGECWQYMGSFRNNGEVIHEMRHRSIPISNDRVVLKFNASDNLNDSDIEKVVKIVN